MRIQTYLILLTMAFSSVRVIMLASIIGLGAKG